MKYFRLVILLSLTVIGFSSCESDILGFSEGGIYGVVKDAETGIPISYAEVYLNGPEQRRVNADANGNFNFEDLGNGNYTLSAEAAKYKTSYEDVTVYESQYSQRDIEMDFYSVLSSDNIDFDSGTDEISVVVTNIFDQDVDISFEENVSWLFVTGGTILGLEPGESTVVRVRLYRFGMSAGTTTTSIIVNVEEDFGFDTIESYVLSVNVQN